MAGETLNAKTFEEGLKQIRNIYKSKSNIFDLISKKQYEAYTNDEREDSDNHLNIEKLGKESDVIDQTFYKYLPNRKIAYQIILMHKDGSKMEDYFLTTPDF